VLSQSIAEQIAFEIQRQIKDSSAFAFLQADQVIFYSRENTSQPPFARSPVVNLIQAVYDFNPEHARRILRSRIFSTVDPSEMCLGMTKVSAKRLTAPIVPVNHGIDAPFRFQELLPILPPPLLEFDILTAESRQLIFEKRFMKSVIQIAQEIPKQAELYHSDRAVAAILISSSGEMLALARNSNAKDSGRLSDFRDLEMLQNVRGCDLALLRGSLLASNLLRSRRSGSECARHCFHPWVLRAKTRCFKRAASHGRNRISNYGTYLNLGERCRARREN
jgi:hypothetical protein